MSKKVFISQPMRNKTPEAIKSERERIIAKVKAEYGDDIEIIDDDKHPLIALTESLQEQERKEDD